MSTGPLARDPEELTAVLAGAGLPMRNGVADAIRELIDAVIDTEVDDEVLGAVIAEVDRATARLRTSGGAFARRVVERGQEDRRSGDVVDFSPMLGRANPLAPPMRIRVADGLVVGRVTFASAYDGPPGHVHGGLLAAAFDEVLGVAQQLSGQAGMTGTLTVRYRRPTPLNTELVFEGGLESVQGRKILTAGRCLHAGLVTAEATGVFIALDQDRWRNLVDDARARPEAPAPRA